ncbi:MAG: deoxyribonuclease V [Gemmatimonadales bacterium]
MNVPRPPHRWAVTPRQATAIQEKLAPTVSRTRPLCPIELVVGVDAAFSRDGRYVIGAAVVWDARRENVLEQRIAKRRVTFPYVPGLLSFREAPAILAALRKLRLEPDAIICDAHGFAHPRRFGLACHVGVVCDRPTIGCAKSRLVGTHEPVGAGRGSRAAVRDGEKVVGSVLRTRDGVRPVYVSVGHRIDLRTAERIVLRCAVRYRLPEPTRLADKLVGEVKRAPG